MRFLLKSIQSWRDYVVLVMTVLLSLGFMFYTNESEKQGGIHLITLELMGRITAPLYAFQSLLNLKEKNSELIYQNAQLQIKNARLSEADKENERLRQLVGFGPYQQLTVTAAKVIGKSKSGGFYTILLKTNKSAAIQKNMPVINAQGLVGKIVSVSPNFAMCQLLKDRNFRAAARIQRTRIEGIFSSRGDQFGFLVGVHHRADVKTGDIVITSGMNSLYPQGLEIGKIVDLKQDERGLFQEVLVDPAVDFESIEEVFVIQHN